MPQGGINKTGIRTRGGNVPLLGNVCNIGSSPQAVALHSTCNARCASLRQRNEQREEKPFAMAMQSLTQGTGSPALNCAEASWPYGNELTSKSKVGITTSTCSGPPIVSNQLLKVGAPLLRLHLCGEQILIGGPKFRLNQTGLCEAFVQFLKKKKKKETGRQHGIAARFSSVSRQLYFSRGTTLFMTDCWHLGSGICGRANCYSCCHLKKKVGVPRPGFQCRYGQEESALSSIFGSMNTFF